MVIGASARRWFDFSGTGKSNVLQRLSWVMIFGIVNLLMLLALWYWLAIKVEDARHADYLASRLQLTTLESENQNLQMKTLALAPSAFFIGVIAGNTHNRPELSYLLDYMRNLARSTQVHLLHVRPGQIDQNGRLSIGVHAEVSQTALANFWAGLMLNIHEVEVQHLDVQRVGSTQKYVLAMSLLVSIGTFIDEQRLLSNALLADDDKDSWSSAEKGKHNKGFILEKDGKRIVYLLGDNHGRLHRVASK